MENKLLDAFKKELWDIEQHWYLFIGLFDKPSRELRREKIYPSSPLLFDLIKLRFHDHIVLQLAKLLDPKETGNPRHGNTNLSLARLLHDLGPFPEDVQIQLDECVVAIDENKGPILEHRKKRIAHNDLANKLDRDLPNIKIAQITTILNNLETALNLMSSFKRGRVHQFFPDKVSDDMNPEHLIEIICAGRESLGV